MTISGIRPLEDIESAAPTVEHLPGEAMDVEDAEVLQFVFEQRTTDVARHLLPPAFFTIAPTLLTFVFHRCADSPIGPFSMAQLRIGCRSGVRPRGFLLGNVVDGDVAASELASRWGFAPRTGEVRLDRGYDSVRGVVRVDGRTILDVMMVRPMPLSSGDVQYVPNMNPAHTSAGLRIVQFDPDYEIRRAERGEPRLQVFDAEAWGDARVDPAWPVSASLVSAKMTLPRIRFLCKPDISALQGTERIA